VPSEQSAKHRPSTLSLRREWGWESPPPSPEPVIPRTGQARVLKRALDRRIEILTESVNRRYLHFGGTAGSLAAAQT
jgi:hypothetical protein